MDADLVRTAHADAWEAHGRFRATLTAGAGAARLPGVRVMSSGLPRPQWNNGDVTDPELVDLDPLRRWYAERRTPSGEPVPWGVRVPAGADWPHGRRLFGKRLMGLQPASFRPAPVPAEVTLRPAGPADADAVVAVDAVAFDEPAEVERPWVEPLLAQPGMTVCLAERGGEPVGVGNVLVTAGDAGPTAYVAGIGVMPAARRNGIGAAVSSWLVERALAAGAGLAHLHPDTEQAAAIYRRLGFVEVAGFDVYVDLAIAR